MAQFVNMFEVDLNNRSYPVSLNQTVSEGNVSSNRIGAYVYKDGQPYNLGGNCTGLVMRADGSTVPLTGVIDGNAAYVVLDQPSCAIPGPIQVAVNWVSGSNTTTLVVAYGTVIQTDTRDYVQPGTPIPDINTLLAAIADMEDATDAANAAANNALGNFAGAFDATIAYPAGTYVTYTDGYMYVLPNGHTADVTWANTTKRRVTVGGEVGYLKNAVISEFINGNAFDILAFVNKSDGSMRGVDYTWNADKTSIVVSGTATGGNSILALAGGANAMPQWVAPGSKYRLKYSATNVFVQVLNYKNGAVASELLKTKTDGEFTVPSDSEGVMIRLFVESSTTVNETVSPAIFTSVPTNEELFSNGNFPRGFVEENTDIDTLIQPGCYLLGVGTYTHHPNPGTSTVLIVFKSTNNVITQFAVGVSKHSTCQRVSTGGVFPETWTTTDFPSNGIIPTNTDIDTIKRQGIWFINSGRDYTHSPFSNVYGGMMLVFEFDSNNVFQIVTKANTGEVYFRSSILGNFPATWGTNGTGAVYNNTYTTEHYENTYNITCSPSITADTNNYLASTNDYTDRTADIQAMLNSTGVCHLGPGRFVVTGIDIPDYGAMIGSGSRTVIYLASTVTNGYAVKLNSYSSIKNVRIYGDDTPLNNGSVGNRHGIIFEGTADAVSPATPVYVQRSQIENCWISSFTGGGITCYNTGLAPAYSLVVCNCQITNCTAGVNVSYFSEFHRWTNVAAQSCYYGCICNGGNNNFANCDFSQNKVALLIDNSTGQSRNNSHGTFSACSFHHSDNTYSGGAIVSVGTAIKILKAANGEVFEGCQIGYGNIEIDESKGIRFNACNVLSKVAMEVTDSSLVVFSDCTFIDTTNNPLTQSGNTTLKYHDCYTLNGSVFDPMS